MRRFGWVAFALFYFMLVGAKSAQAEKRIALLIANQGYSTSVGILKNPFNDIAVVGDALSKQGFEILPPIKNGKRSAMLGGVRDLVRRLNAAGGGAIGFIYYSGHGAAEKDTNINYLIPVDASAPGTSAFWDDSVKLDDVLRLLDGARSAAKFIVFDACRNELQLPTKDTSKGLVPVAEQQGMFIAYASAPGRTASDMGDKSGPYAAALAAELAHPGLDHLNLFQNVKEAVLTATGGAQQPWESNGLGRRVFLTGQAKPLEAAQSPSTSPRSSEAVEAWDRTKDTASIAALEAFIARYKDTYYAVLARLRIDELKKQQVAIASPPKAPAPESYPKPAPAVPPTPPESRCDGVEALVGNEKRCLRPKDVFKDCPNCPEIVVVPAGEFMMGSNAGDPDAKPMHEVTIAKPFGVGKFAVTFSEWDACVAAGGCKHKPEDQGWGRGTRPVINVSWNDATKEYLPWLSRETGKPYRLLTEAEWEYAARAGTNAAYSWGNDVGKGNANCAGCGSQWDNGQTAPVGSFKPNAFGLYDMLGNVWHWVQDCYHDKYQGAPTNGSAWGTSCTDASRRVVRGGSWGDDPRYLYLAHRYKGYADERYYSGGFRLARTLSP
jgi:formylglycine-generating enzyme required for sulfatase activity